MKPGRNIADTFRRIFDIYIKSSLHVGLAVTSFSYITVLEFDLSISSALLPFIFFSTVAAYNFTKYLSLADRRHLVFTSVLKAISFVTLFAFMCALISAFYLDLSTLGFTVIPALLTASYALPLFQNQTNLRQVYGAKLFIIATVWALVTVGLPFINHQGIMPEFRFIIAESFQRLLFVMVLTLPFDIRDLHSDTDQLGTIPQIFGVRTTKILGIIALITVVIIEIQLMQAFTPTFLVFLFIVLLTGLLIQKSMAVQSAYFSSFWVEGVPILWAVLLFLVV